MHCADENDWLLSNCCWARINKDRCSECHENCWVQEEEQEEANILLEKQVDRTIDMFNEVHALFSYQRN